MKFIDINRLSYLSVAVVITGCALLGPGEAMADTPNADQTISGDSGSAEAAAQTGSGQVVETRKQKRKKKGRSKKVCRRERVTGSHMRQRVCRSQAEIDARREADQRIMNQIQPSTGGSSS